MPALIVFAILAALLGLLLLTQATAGVGFLAVACLLAIFGRIAQASAHHGRVLEAMKRPPTTVAPER